MASIFTYDPNPPRVSSPWSTPGSMTPTASGNEEPYQRVSSKNLSQSYSTPILLQDTGITKLEAEPQGGSTEYKLHLLLRPRRTFTFSTTGMDLYGSSHSRLHLLPHTLPDNLQVSKSGHGPSNLTRQIRLQQLTTQLLWRLQQSSPFHSSSPGDLVLPKLPEASPKLGLPSKRAPLLPGLEESQGALYEIGVSDDGALVGLIEEELEESLVNLKAMAASLGCVVQVLRKVAVGECEWARSDSPTNRTTSRGTLWVAEALVRPDVDADENAKEQKNGHGYSDGGNPMSTTELEVPTPRSKAEQARVALTGTTTAGKSSLLGTLSTSTLDNGRGKSRLSLLRHRHEITSGVTSSVAQELIGYHAIDEDDGQKAWKVINYATSDVSSWIDLHHLAHRLVFLSDSPGQTRYAKSTFRTLVSWTPHWTVVCIPADEDEADTGKVGTASAAADHVQDTSSSLAHIALCLRMNLPMVVAITKMDLATKSGLRITLGQVLSALKDAARKPVILSNAPVRLGDVAPDLQTLNHRESLEIETLIASSEFSSESVPIVLTSALTGLGVGKLHALLSLLPLMIGGPAMNMAQLEPNSSMRTPVALFHTDEVFMIPPSKVYGSHNTDSAADQGVVLCGHMARGAVSVGDILMLGPFGAELATTDSRNSTSIRRSSSHSASVSKSHSKGSPLLGTRRSAEFKDGTDSIFVNVRVVSIRNLRLPVRTLLEGQVGTVGVDLLDSNPTSRLSRARKGMVLMQVFPDATGYRSITVKFSAAAFMATMSPTLILGGHAIAYVNAIRAAVKVTSLVFAPIRQDSSSIFEFEEETNDPDSQEVRITFRFVSSIEWVLVGDKVLIVPTASATGPVAGHVNTGASTGLSGFVGTVCETVV